MSRLVLLERALEVEEQDSRLGRVYVSRGGLCRGERKGRGVILRNEGGDWETRISRLTARVRSKVYRSRKDEERVVSMRTVVSRVVDARRSWRVNISEIMVSEGEL